MASANLVGSTFEGSDGNLVVTTPGNTDWANVDNLNTGIDNASGSADNAFGKGAKEDLSTVTVVDGSIPPNKNDLTRFYEASEMASNSHIYLYLGWERMVNIGNANLDFEINQKATDGFTSTVTGPVSLNRTAGDLLVTYDFSGSGTPTLGLNTWLTAANDSASQCYSANSLPCWGKHIDLSTSDSAEGAVNTGTVSDPILGADLTAGLFGEAAIDLTKAGVFQSGVCKAFGSAFLKSRSSSSFTAELKDFIAPVPVEISNCGSITIKKVTQNGDSTFGYTTTGGLDPSTFSLSNDGQTTYSDLSAGSYSVTETLTAAQVTAGWTLKDLTCTATGTGSSYTKDGATANITMGIGGQVDCTYTNHIKLNPSISTELSKTTANVNDSITDSATLSGATASAGGTVVYHAYKGANTCTGTDLLNDTVNVTNGSVPSSKAFVPTEAGYYSFQAYYGGDADNNPATSTCSSEQLLVKTSPTIGTTLSQTTANINDSITDSATLTGATSDAGGTVVYHAYEGANTCSGTDLLNSTVNVTNGSVPDSTAFKPTKAGYYSFQAVYSGDTKNNGATSTCSSEQLLVKTNPTIGTSLSATSVDVGSSVYDTAALTGATSDVGGTVTYTVYTDTACTKNPRSAGTVTITNTGTIPQSDSLAFNSAGTYYWQAFYSGDSKNNSATSVCTDETLVVNKLQPGVSTAQKLVPDDSFTLSGATSDATGTITFKLFDPSEPSCGGSPVWTVTVDVTGNGTYSTGNDGTHIADTAGTWRWLSTYSGDANNKSATSACGTERFTIVNS